MTIGKLFKSLVISGVMLGASGCKTTAPAESEAANGPNGEARIEVDCEAVCSGPPSNGVICPDPNQDDGSSNCCWLMQPEKHVCCP